MKLHITSTKPIAEARAHALALLREAISEARLALIDSVDQADVYRAKYFAALRFVGSGTPEAYVTSYAEHAGITQADAAAAIISAHEAARVAQVAIERTRLDAKHAILNAASNSEVYAALRTAKQQLT